MSKELLDQVMNLPNAELTELAATKVMGWTAGGFGLWIGKEGEEVSSLELFRPSEDMTSAWMLNERMRELSNNHAVSIIHRYCESLRAVALRRLNWNPVRARNELVLLLTHGHPIDLTRAAVLTAMEADHADF